MPNPKDPPGMSTQVGYPTPPVAARAKSAREEWEESTTVENVRSFQLDEFGRTGRASGGAPTAVAPHPPAVEITFVHEPQVPPAARKVPWRAVEIWTQNRIYALDSTMTCVEVVGRATGQPEPGHSLLGARLTGGQLREGTTLEISHPFPVPGADAMFQHPPKHRVRFGQTSRVERVVLRVRVTTVALADAEALWEDITAHPRK
jgi:hypothetical protein